MRLLLSALLVLTSTASFAKEAPEVFTLKVRPKLERCVGDTKTRTMECSKQAEGSTVEALKLTLSECRDKTTFGKLCEGAWEKVLEMDGAKFNYSVRVSRAEKQAFKYIVSQRICRFDITGDSCSSQTSFLKEPTLPYLITFSGPGFWRNEFRGGRDYDASVHYSSGLELGEGAGSDL